MAANFFWTFLLLAVVCLIAIFMAAVTEWPKYKHVAERWELAFDFFATLTIASAIWWIWS